MNLVIKIIHKLMYLGREQESEKDYRLSRGMKIGEIVIFIHGIQLTEDFHGLLQ